MSYILSLVIFFQAPVKTQKPEVRALASQFMCPCGCGRVVVNCDCGTAYKMQEEIASLLDKGFTPEQIVNNYVNQYGESILASPLKKGFNWTGYILPFAVALISVFIIFYFIRSQKKSTYILEESEKKVISEEERKKIEKELEDIE